MGGGYVYGSYPGIDQKTAEIGWVVRVDESGLGLIAVRQCSAPCEDVRSGLRIGQTQAVTGLGLVDCTGVGP
jgi:hypothetical protein